MKYLKDFDVAGKRVLVRCDFNVPIDDSGSISNDFRIKKTLPTLRYLMANKAKVIIISHLGEPEGKIIPLLTLDRVKEALEKLLKVPVVKTDDCVGPEVLQKISELQPGQVLLLENVRFHKEETDNNAEFGKQLSELGQIYINDAFADCHRAHASMVAPPTFLPSGAGLLLQQEIENLNAILQHPKKPMIVLVGGAKVGTKAKFINNILRLADGVIVSGLIQKELLEKNIVFDKKEKILSPADFLDAMDIGQDTIKIFTAKIKTAKTVVWNGPFGKFEDQQYKKGTLALAKAIIKSGAFSVVGGGETIEFLDKEGMIDKFSHISTGGGAMLEYLSGEELPGLKALELKYGQNQN